MAPSFPVCHAHDGLSELMIPALRPAFPSFPRLPWNGGEDFLGLLRSALANAPAKAGCEVVLVIIDCLDDLLGLANIDPWKSSEVRHALKSLWEIAKAINAAVLIIHHLRKNTSGGAHSAMLGSTAIRGLARSVLMLGVHSDHGLCLAHEKCNDADRAPTLRCRLEDGRFEILDEVEASADDLIHTVRPRGRPPESRQRAVQWLEHALEQRGGEAPAKELLEAAEKAGIAERTLRRAAKALGVEYRNEGFPRRTIWRLPQSGQSGQLGYNKELFGLTGDGNEKSIVYQGLTRNHSQAKRSQDKNQVARMEAALAGEEEMDRAYF